MNPLICAIDVADKKQAKKLIAQVRPQVGHIKLGLEFFTRFGPKGVRKVAKETPVFLDLKFHDIPNTVAGAVRSAVRTECRMLTIHASGGADMCRAAQEAAEEEADRLGVAVPTLLAVTVLTSLDNTALTTVGCRDGVELQALRLAELALRAGIPGLVSSPQEIAIFRKHFGKDPVIVTPGIRPAGSDKGDQARTMTPKDAIALGANHLVVGRPITQADNPAEAAKAIFSSL